MSHTLHIAHTTCIARTARFRKCTNAETAHTAYIVSPPCIPHAAYGVDIAHLHILHTCMACNAYAKIACTQPRQPIQTDIGATHVTQDGYNIITYTKQQKPKGFDEN